MHLTSDTIINNHLNREDMKKIVLHTTKTFPLILALCFAFLTPMLVNAGVQYATPLSVDSEEFEIGNFLAWSTANEINSKAFYVEKSLDGVNFENIAEIDAAGFSNAERNYRYMDIQVTDKVVYYRLKQQDTDGTESETDIIKVTKTMENNFTIADFSDIYVEDVFEVSINAFEAGEMEYSLVSYKGEEIFSTTKIVDEGINQFEINLKEEKEGKYSVSFKMGDEVEKLNILKAEDQLRKKPNVASKKDSNGG